MRKPRATVAMMLAPASYGMIQCPNCNGTGRSRETAPRCTWCDGSGLIYKADRIVALKFELRELENLVCSRETVDPSRAQARLDALRAELAKLEATK